ncbi:MAG TPA: hypothetical protein ENK88_08980 [Campylobacterales bacterium]|nr:hypothetical protein [Campylobacterales bacterium]HHD80785.1 hypothetical protein [Campylobacterales bacterium]HHH51939.1 hypothetical protein [Campylobacterales bacterium]
MILYIHGFRTTINSHKAKLLQAQYPADKIFIADHPITPKEAIDYLEKVIKEQNINSIIASSLGGYYATYLSEKYNIKTVLINPSVKPYETLKTSLGENIKNDGTYFIWREEDMKMLEKFKIINPTPSNYFVFLQKGDEVLDFRVAQEFYKGSKFIIEDGGNHRFKKFERFFDDVSDFFN